MADKYEDFSKFPAKRFKNSLQKPGGWERELELSLRTGRGKPSPYPKTGCTQCNGSGMMDRGLDKVYCNCRYPASLAI